LDALEQSKHVGERVSTRRGRQLTAYTDLPKGHEDSAGHLVGVEVKAGGTLGAGDVHGLRALSNAAGKRWVRGVVLYPGSEIIPFAGNLHGIPMPLLWRAHTGDQPIST